MTAHMMAQRPQTMLQGTSRQAHRARRARQAGSAPAEAWPLVLEVWDVRAVRGTRAAVAAIPATLTLFFAVYLAGFLTLGGGLRTGLWAHGAHATPEEWQLHAAFQRMGVSDHHAHVTHHGHSHSAWEEDPYGVPLRDDFAAPTTAAPQVAPLATSAPLAAVASIVAGVANVVLVPALPAALQSAVDGLSFVAAPAVRPALPLATAGLSVSPAASPPETPLPPPDQPPRQAR